MFTIDCMIVHMHIKCAKCMFSLFQTVGCAVVGCMLWVLVTSPALRDFFMGTTVSYTF